MTNDQPSARDRHVAAIECELNALPRFGRGNRRRAVRLIAGYGDIYAQHVASVAQGLARAPMATQLADALAERDELARKLAGLDATEAQLLAENEELNRQLAERISELAQALSDLKRRTAAHATAEQRLTVARQTLAESGYFTLDEIGDDIAPRIAELREHLQEDLDDAAETIRQLREQVAQLAAERAPASNCASHGMDERCFDCATDAELAAAIPPAPAPVAEPAPARATRARGSRAKAGAGQDMPGRSESLTAPSLGTEESGFAE